jgi:hypothetical protein
VRAVFGRGRETKIKTKANRCGVCYYSIVVMRVRLCFGTYYVYKSSIRHIHDPVLSSLKMKGIRYLFFPTAISS